MKAAISFPNLSGKILLRTGLVFLAVALTAAAQTPVQLSPAALAQLQVQQPLVEDAGPVTGIANFDPPAVKPGETAYYRVTLTAPQNMIIWPEKIPKSSALDLGRPSIGQIRFLDGNRLRIQTTFLFEVTPGAAGTFTVPTFTVDCGGRKTEVPAALLEARAEATTSARRLILELSETNLFLGQPTRLRVILFPERGNEIDALREVEVDAEGLMIDKTSLRQAVESIARDGQFRPAFIYEVKVTPIAHGPISIRAQAFAAGRDLSGPVTISGQVTLAAGPPNYRMLLSEQMALRVRPVPSEGELPGFTGTIGKFRLHEARLSTNRVQAGEPLHLKVVFQGEGNLNRFVPPEIPRSREWQIIADNSDGNSFTLIPLTDEAAATPAIPFSAFDPESEKFYDLTIPPLPAIVSGPGFATQIARTSDMKNPGVPLQISPAAKAAGRTVASLTPLQMQGWFVFLQLLPAFGLLLLWRWDEQRRFLEAHPEIIRRRAAKRLLRRERKRMQQAAASGAADKFLLHARRALQAGAAPHFPAETGAMVGADVLAILPAAEQGDEAAEVVRNIFSADDGRFALAPRIQISPLEWLPATERLLAKMEARL